MEETMTHDKAPRRWRLESLFEDGDDLPVVKEGPSVSGYDAEIEVIEASAYDAILKERDELLKRVKVRVEDILELEAELQRERRKVGKLKGVVSDMCTLCVREEKQEKFSAKIQAELEAIDNEGE
jgi:hypothetical protein